MVEMKEIFGCSLRHIFVGAVSLNISTVYVICAYSRLAMSFLALFLVFKALVTFDRMR